ncbi:retrovirus-related Pol polyprotein from transposon 297 [Trichonephila clavipes]|nr:retrovirus-related Pol polyprotein from transposon 297 [Trichonephila clavipes]
MIASFIEENHENWDQFLHEFAFALRTVVNETTNKTPAELFWGRKIITPFSKLINVTEDTKYVGRNIERLFDEARQNMRNKHKSWEKCYNRRRRDVHIKVNDLVLLQTHFLSAAGRKQVGKFMPKFEDPYKVLEIKGNNLVIWKNGRNITVNIDQVRVYRPRQSDTVSSDSPVETLYDEQEVSHGSNRSNQGQFKEHRKTSSQESERYRSRQGNATREIPRNKRKINSTASKDQALKRSKICRKRSRQGSEHQDRKRRAPEQRQGVKRSIPSSISSRNYKFQKHNTSSSGVESIAGPSRLPDRRTATTTGGSRMEVSGRDNQTRQTRATTRGRSKQAEKPIRSNQTNTRRPCPYYLRSRIQENDGIPEEMSNIEINGILTANYEEEASVWKRWMEFQYIGFNRQNPVTFRNGPACNEGCRRDLLELAETLSITIQDNFKFLDIEDAILNSEGYDAEFTCECLNRIISDRKELELRAERDRENQRIFELQKLITDTSINADSNMPKLELHKLLPIFDPKTTDVTIFLDLFERQLTFLKVPVPQWVVYLVGLLPTEVSNLITKESFADAQDYYKVKQILLKRFKLSAEKFRQMFSRHTKDPVKTWRDFYFDLQTYFDGWLKESKVTTLEELKDLIVADQIKKKTPQDYKDHFLDQWCNWNNPLQLVDKLDSYEEVKNMRNKNNKNFSRKQKDMNSSPWRSNYTQNPKLSYEHSLSGFPSQSRRETGIPSNSRRNPISKDRIPEKKIVDTKENRTPVSCYGCGAPGIIRSRCHTCNPVRQKDDALSSSLNQSNFYSFSSESNPINIIQISICNTEAAVCADTGATHSVAGEKLYHLLKQKGLNFEEKPCR